MENETRIFNIHPHLSIFNFHPLIKNKSRAFNLQMLTRKASTVSFAVKVEQTGLEEIIIIKIVLRIVIINLILVFMRIINVKMSDS